MFFETYGGVAWKRSQAARTFYYFPEVKELFKAGKTHLSNIVLIASRITEANSKKILEFLPGATKRDLQLFLHNIMADGTVLERDPTIQVRFDFTKQLLEKLDRAQTLLNTNCPGATQEEVLERALDTLLSKIDPVEKAKRAELRAEKKKEAPVKSPNPDCPGAVGKAIPAKTKHLLFLNKPQCEYVSPDGRRCTATCYLQIDHIQMRCRGGTNDKSNLRILCAEHNLFEAERNLGREFIFNKISSQSVVLN